MKFFMLGKFKQPIKLSSQISVQKQKYLKKEKKTKNKEIAKIRSSAELHKFMFDKLTYIYKNINKKPNTFNQ